MKKSNIILLALFYVLLSAGIAKSTHYCMGKVLSVAYFSTQADTCVCDDSTEAMHGCCKDETELIKIEYDQQKVKLDLDEKSLYFIKPVIVPTEFSALINNIEEDFEFHGYDLPPPNKIPVYKLNCNFTYYG